MSKHELIERLKSVLNNPYKVFSAGAMLGVFNWVPDKMYIQLIFRAQMGKWPNLDEPKTFNEKLQWLKLYDRKPEYKIMVDKLKMKQYVTGLIGDEYTIPTLGVWDKFDDINFDLLPNQFVLKCTHDSGGLIICKDKGNFDKETARKKINKCLKQNYYYRHREWAYKDVPHRIIAEPLMVDESGTELKDYKIFCFNGCPEYVEVDFNRFIEHKLNPYDFEWNPLNFCDKSKNDYKADIKKPVRLDDMRHIAEKISSEHKFIRVDFYSINDKIYVGELTLCPGSGLIAFEPEEMDLYYGNKLQLG